MSLVPRAGVEPFPGYRLTKRLGVGGFGEVWQAEAPGGYAVALKFLRLLDQRAAVEVKALQSIRNIRHPNLLDIQFATQVGPFLIVGSPLCDKSLLDRFEECQKQGFIGIPRAELIRYMEGAASGIDYLHQLRHVLPDGRRVSMIHRDVKPHNILIVGDSVRVADFGLVKALDGSVTTNTGVMTPYYAAPEMLLGRATPASDQYGLAATYCHVRCGQLLFEGDLYAITSGHVHSPPNLEKLPAPEAEVLARALAKTPDERWPTCSEFIRELRRAAEQSPEEHPTQSLAGWPGVGGASAELKTIPLPDFAPGRDLGATSSMEPVGSQDLETLETLDVISLDEVPATTSEGLGGSAKSAAPTPAPPRRETPTSPTLDMVSMEQAMTLVPGAIARHVSDEAFPTLHEISLDDEPATPTARTNQGSRRFVVAGVALAVLAMAGAFFAFPILRVDEAATTAPARESTNVAQASLADATRAEAAKPTADAENPTAETASTQPAPATQSATATDAKATAQAPAIVAELPALPTTVGVALPQSPPGDLAAGTVARARLPDWESPFTESDERARLLARLTPPLEQSARQSPTKPTASRSLPRPVAEGPSSKMKRIELPAPPDQSLDHHLLMSLERLFKNDLVEVEVSGTGVYVGPQRVAQLSKGRRFRVYECQGHYILIKGLIGGQDLTGWILRQNVRKVARLEPAEGTPINGIPYGP